MDGDPSGSTRLTRLAEPAVIPELRHLAARLATEAGAGQQVVEDAALAVTEAVTNVVQHAYPGTDSGLVEFTATARGAWLELTVADQGRGWGVRQSDGMGMGLAIIAQISDALEISQGDLGIELQIRFRLDSA